MVLEIAVGIVLAVLILRFWPVILGLGVALLVLGIVLIPVGLFVVWAVEDAAGFGVIAAIAGASFLLAWFTRAKPETERRRSLGYDGGVKSSSDSDATTEEQRRRSIGYDDGGDKQGH